jgi:hypothetical protein
MKNPTYSDFRKAGYRAAESLRCAKVCREFDAVNAASLAPRL